jgi:hypothetical protein
MRWLRRTDGPRVGQRELNMEGLDREPQISEDWSVLLTDRSLFGFLLIQQKSDTTESPAFTHTM